MEGRKIGFVNVYSDGMSRYTGSRVHGSAADAEGSRNAEKTWGTDVWLGVSEISIVEKPEEGFAPWI